VVLFISPSLYWNGGWYYVGKGFPLIWEQPVIIKKKKKDRLIIYYTLLEWRVVERGPFIWEQPVIIKKKKDRLISLHTSGMIIFFYEWRHS